MTNEKQSMIDYKTKIQNNVLILLEDYARSPKAVSHKAKGVEYVLFPDYDNPILNGVLQTGAVDTATIEAIKHNIAEYDVPYVWWDMTFANASLLETMGYTRSSQSPMMVLALDDATEQVALPPNFHIERIRDAEKFRAWLSIFIRSFGLPDKLTQGVYEVWHHIGFDGRLQHFLGWLDDIPVAVASANITSHQDIVGVFNIGVVDDMRKQGFGTIITGQVLSYARESGVHHAYLESSQMGLKVYARMGFKEIFRLSKYMLKED